MVLLRVAPYREIAHEVATRLLESREGSDPLAPWKEEVIVPSRGVADAIADASTSFQIACVSALGP